MSNYQDCYDLMVSNQAFEEFNAEEGGEAAQADWEDFDSIQAWEFFV